MFGRSHLRVLALFVGATLLVACSIDRTGLETASGTGSGGTIGTGGRLGLVGTGGGPVAGTGGVIGTGGVTGTGGATSSCNPSTCPDGCCMGSACLTNHDDQNCGSAGAACAACAACFQCSDAGVCELDPKAKWDVICSSVTISPTKPMNVPWDVATPGINPLPDPYCQFTLDGVAQAKTMTILNTLTPVWNQAITPMNMDVTESNLISQAGHWQVGVIDEDVGAVTVDPVCATAPHLTAADFVAGTVVLPSTPTCTNLTIQLVCAQ